MQKFTSFIFPLVIIIAISFGSCSDDNPTNNTPTTSSSLYTRLGGSTAIDTVVAVFINNVVADDSVNFFFAGVLSDTTGTRYRLLRQNLVQQICMVSGGPCLYLGKDMKTAHTGMNIRLTQFNALVGDLVAAMNTLGVPQAEQNELLAILGPLCPQIVNNGNGGGGC